MCSWREDKGEVRSRGRRTVSYPCSGGDSFHAFGSLLSQLLGNVSFFFRRLVGHVGPVHDPNGHTSQIHLIGVKLVTAPVLNHSQQTPQCFLALFFFCFFFLRQSQRLRLGQVIDSDGQEHVEEDDWRT